VLEFRGLNLPLWLKFSICIGFDLFDMTAGRVLVLGTSFVPEGVSAILMYALWGPMGLISAWEIADPTEIADGFVPTNTLIAWAAYKRGALPQA